MNKSIKAAALVAFFTLGLFATTARADVAMYLSEVGDDVVLSFSGQLDYHNTGANFPQGQTMIVPGAALIISKDPAASAITVTASTFTGPTSISSGPMVSFTSPTGDTFGIVGANGQLLLPGDYVLGTAISGGGTLENQTFTSLDLNDGDTFEWTFTSDLGTDTVTLTIGDAPVPEPATMSLLAIGAIGLIKRRRK